jgi:hypothetical protein
MKEFIDTYSDDIIYLKEGRRALLTHPLRKEIKFLCDASYCRMLAIMMIGSIEMMFAEWEKQDRNEVLKMWFSKNDKEGKPIKNGDRVIALYNAFKDAGINVDKEVFEDFLAIKYLRNTIIHTDWKDYGKDWLEKRGFPTDTRELSEKDWNRMLNVNDNMMLYISLTSLVDNSNGASKSDAPVKIPDIQQKVDLGIIRESDLKIIFWSNLERISDHIRKSIENAVQEKGENHFLELTQEDFEKLSDLEKKILWYNAAQKVGLISNELFEDEIELIQDALYSWKEFFRITFEKEGITIDDLIQAKKTLETLNEKGSYLDLPTIQPILHTMESDVAVELLKHSIKNYKPISEMEIVHTLRLGDLAYQTMQNISPVFLFNVYLPIIDPIKMKDYFEIGSDALIAMELREYWYNYVEYKKLPTVDSFTLIKKIKESFQKTQTE